MGDWLMRGADAVYSRTIRPLLFSQPPDNAHTTTVRLLGILDTFPAIARMFRPAVAQACRVGGVDLDSPVIVAAGLVKGRGFSEEATAVETAKHVNIVPGWRSVPLLCGAVEIGSFTRFPRTGNQGTVMWRDRATRSTQNRIGLRNPGAKAAAEFLSRHRPPGSFGISIASTPGEDDPVVQAAHIADSIAFFCSYGASPSWFTINLSCPNTDDDQQAIQTGELAEAVCREAVRWAGGVPVWVKVGPDLSDEQYEALVDAFGRSGIRAVVATNTLAAPVGQGGPIAGIGGGRLFDQALSVVLKLFALREKRGLRFDIVGCGGIMDGNGLRSYTDAGAQAVQVWSALVYRGPFAPAHIAREYAAMREDIN
jgi:dihydroorotate dehydrogenase